MVEKSSSGLYISRRGFLGATGAAAALAALAACGSSGGSSSGGASGGGSGKSLKFWDMPWGGTAYNPAAKKLVESYKPTGGNLQATYQEIQWANFTQTFSSAIASKTGPAVSTGGGFQAFQYAAAGRDRLRRQSDRDAQDGRHVRRLLGRPGRGDEDAKGYAAVPWQLDIRVWWYNKKIFDQLGSDPADVVGRSDDGRQGAEAAKGYYGFAAGAGAGNNLGAHHMVMMMINNGGGMFDADGKLDCVTRRTSRPCSSSRSWSRREDHRPALGELHGRQPERGSGRTVSSRWASTQPALAGNIGDTSGDLALMKPLSSPSGKQACLVFENNIMMYTNTPSQAGSEAFLGLVHQEHE